MRASVAVAAIHGCGFTGGRALAKWPALETPAKSVRRRVAEGDEAIYRQLRRLPIVGESGT